MNTLNNDNNNVKTKQTLYLTLGILFGPSLGLIFRSTILGIVLTIIGLGIDYKTSNKNSKDIISKIINELYIWLSSLIFILFTIISLCIILTIKSLLLQ